MLVPHSPTQIFHLSCQGCKGYKGSGMQSLSLLLSVLDDFHSNPTAILLPASRATFIISNSKLSEEGPKRSETKTEPAVLLILLAKDSRCLIQRLGARELLLSCACCPDRGMRLSLCYKHWLPVL